MKRMNLRWAGGFVLLMMVLSVISCASGNSAKQNAAATSPEHKKMAEYMEGVAESKSAVVAKVNESAITLYDLIGVMNRVAPKYMVHGEVLTPEMDQKVRDEALDTLIFRELAIQEAVRQGMTIPPGYVEEALKKIKENIGTEEAYRINLDIAGSTEESLKKEIERTRLFDMIADREIFQKAKVDEEKEQAISKRKQEWEAELKKAAKIEIILGVEIKDGTGKSGKE